MATCRKCIHWHKCSKPNGITRYCGEKIAHDSVEECCEWFISTAEVVPRSEVERLQAQVENLEIIEKDLRFRNKEFQKANEGLAKNIENLEIENDILREAKQEIAREIFYEFGKMCCTNAEDYEIFAELRKKYTGE